MRSYVKLRQLSVVALTCLGFIACSSDGPGAGAAPPPDVGDDVASAAVASAITALPSANVVTTGRLGRPTFLVGDLGQVSASGLRGASAIATIAPLLPKIAPAFAIDASELRARPAHVDELGFTHVKYDRVLNGIPVVGAQLMVHLDGSGKAYSAQANGVRTAGALTSATIAQPAAAWTAVTADVTIHGAKQTGSRLVYIADAAGDARLAYEIEVSGERDNGAARDLVFVDATTGAVLDRHAQIETALVRNIFTAKNVAVRPGELARAQGDAPIADGVVNANYNRLGDAYGCFRDLFLRDSADGAGGTITSTVHYGTNVNNSWSDGNTLWFGDGDGTSFGTFGVDLDVVAHEFTHTVTKNSAALIYQNESGAMNESMSDVFAAACSAKVDGLSANTWHMAEGVYTPGIAGDALRYLDDPARDGSSADFFPTRSIGAADAGFVHSNSGIGNLAFYLASQGGHHPRGKTTVEVPALGVTKAGKIWYRALTVYMTPSTDFGDARVATAQAALDLYGPGESYAVNAAWSAVGVFPFSDGYKAHEQLCVNNDECRLGDVNGDGKADLIAFSRGLPGSPAYGDVWVALSNGSTFGTAYKAHDQLCVGDNTCRVGDVNGDGKADIVAFMRGAPGSVEYGDVWVALSNGSTFGAGYKAQEQMCVGSDQCEVGDINGDGKADILGFMRGAPGSVGYGDVWAALSNGSTFGAGYKAQEQMCVLDDECRVGDINGDGKADIVAFSRGVPTSATYGDVWAALSTGTTFSAGFKAHDQLCVGDEQCAVGDINGDGKADIVAFLRGAPGSAGYGNVWAAHSTGAAFGPGYLVHNQMCVSTDVCQVADFTGDRKADLVAFARGASTSPAFGDVWVAPARR